MISYRPLFTIVTCTLNSKKYLSTNIRSVKKQTYHDFEHIFVDGNSIDGTKEIITQYMLSKDVVVKKITSREKGISKAMNLGLMGARGEYVLFLHADDSLFDNNVLSRISKFLKSKEFPDWIYGKIRVIEESGKIVGTFPEKIMLQKPYYNLLKYTNYIPHQAAFVKTRILKDIGGFDEKLSSGMDYDLWLRLSKANKGFFINRTISNYMIRKGAQSSSRQNLRENMSNEDLVVRRYLNKFEYTLHVLVRQLERLYNKTLR